MKCNLNIIIDASFSMSLGKLEAINHFFKEEFNEVIEEVNLESKDLINLSVLSFNDKANWVLKDKDLKQKIVWDELVACGRSKINNALNLLNNANNGNYNFNILISDGYIDDLDEQMFDPKEIKYGLLIGSEYKETRNKMIKYTGETKRVITLYFDYDLKRIFKIILDSIVKAENLNLIIRIIYHCFKSRNDGIFLFLSIVKNKSINSLIFSSENIF